MSIADLRRVMDERVRLVSVTHVPTSSGLVNDVAAVGEVVAGTDALYLVDACQSVGQMPDRRVDDRLPPALGDGTQVPARPARHRVPVRRSAPPRRAAAAGRRPPLGHAGRANAPSSCARRPALRAVGAQHRRRPRPRGGGRLRAVGGASTTRTPGSRRWPRTLRSRLADVAGVTVRDVGVRAVRHRDVHRRGSVRRRRDPVRSRPRGAHLARRRPGVAVRHDRARARRGQPGVGALLQHRRRARRALCGARGAR